MTDIVVPKPWGFEEIIWKRTDFQFKIMHINKFETTSLHMHLKKRETLLCIDNECIIYRNKDVGIYFNAGQMLTIEPKDRHRIQALKDDVTLVEMCSGLDSDILRIDDKHGRI